MNSLAVRQRRRAEDTMVAEILKHLPLTQSTANAMRSVDRLPFIPKGLTHSAYKLDALPINGKQFISSPLTVAKMTHYLDLEGVDSVLEVGCGSGYQAAVLSKLVRRVFTIERIEALLKEAQTRFKSQGFHNIHVRLADGQEGWRQYAPFDRILFSATASTIPRALFDQLGEKGVLLAPMQRGDVQQIVRYTKSQGSLREEVLERCEFVPVLSGIQRS